MRHGDPQPNEEFPTAVWLGPDPELALVHADMDAWAVHDCHIMWEGHCDCDADEDCLIRYEGDDDA